jgi:hypothetical protein
MGIVSRFGKVGVIDTNRTFASGFYHQIKITVVLRYLIKLSESDISISVYLLHDIVVIIVCHGSNGRNMR